MKALSVLVQVREYLLSSWWWNDNSCTPCKVHNHPAERMVVYFAWGARVVIPPPGREQVFANLYQVSVNPQKDCVDLSEGRCDVFDL